MSHSVTITRTTTSTTNTSYIVLNTGYLKSVPGILKFFEMIICAAIVGIAAHFYGHYSSPIAKHPAEIFLLLMATTFMIGTFCLLLSCLISLSTGGIIAKTIYELIYHAIAAILLAAASINMIIALNDNYKSTDMYKSYMAAGVLGLVNTILYLVSAWKAHKSYRGI